MPYVTEDDLKSALANLRYLIAHIKDPHRIADYEQMRAECHERLLVMLNPLTAKRLRRAKVLLAASERNLTSTRSLLTEYRARRNREVA